MVVGGVNGYRPHYSWVEATRVSVNTLTPTSSRRVLTPRPSRWQRDALPLSYYCDGGTGWTFTSVARVAIGYLNPRSRRQGCGGGHRTPDDGGQQPPALPLSYSALQFAGHGTAPYRHGVLTPGFRAENPTDFHYPMAAGGDAGRFRSDILRVEGPACFRCTTAPARKVEVSNPHGRTVYLLSKQGAPANEAYLPRSEGQRIERWRGCPRPSLSKRAPFLSVNPPIHCVGFAGRQQPHRFDEDRSRSRATTRSRPGDLSRTRAALFQLSYGGVASSTGLEPVASAFGGQRSHPSELRQDGTPARTRTRNWRFVVSCDHPFHHQGLAPQTGFDPVASAVTRRRSPD
jgi:hypothetical protein